MIRAVIAISVASMMLLFFRSSEIMAHLGRNPVSGGNPPVDSKISEIVGSIIGVLLHMSDKELMLLDELCFSIINVGTVRLM